MSLSSIAFVVCFLLVALIAWAAVTSAGRAWRKAVALAALLMLIPAGHVTVSELLGRPKPASTAFLEDLDSYHRVIAYDIDEDNAIFLWLDMAGDTGSRVFSFPYDTTTVARLQDADDRARSLASNLLARLESTDRTPSGNRLEFVSETEFKRQLPRKPPDPTDMEGMLAEEAEGGTIAITPSPQ